MHRIFLPLFALLFCVPLCAQQPAMQWPIAGHQAGQNILFRPQDYLADELNFAHLIIGGEEADTVVAPCEGVIASVHLVYLSKLTEMTTFGAEGSFDEMLQAHRAEAEKRGFNPHYLTLSLTIRTAEGQKVHLSGLRPLREWRTGQAVTLADTLGLVHYAYERVPRPSLALSVSDAANKPADPMSPFGLPTTFIPARPRTRGQQLSREQAQADYHQLASSIREIYPSLHDFFADDEAFDAYIAEQIARLPERLSLAEFARRLMELNTRIHDAHLWFNFDVETSLNPGSRMSPLLFGCADSALRVISATEEYVHLIGRPISHINGMPADSIVALLEYAGEQTYDRDVRSVREQDRAAFLFYYYFKYIPGAQRSHTVFTFADGEEMTIPTADIRRTRYHRSHYRHYIDALMGVPRQTFVTGMANDSTATLRLRTFDLMQTEADSLLLFLDSCQTAGVKHMVIDLRGNPGGDAQVMTRLVHAFVPQPSQRPGAHCRVNAQRFYSPTQNLVPGEVMFADFEPRPGAEGLYLADSIAQLPDSIAPRYSGRLYVIINAKSASAAAQFAGILKRQHRAYILGRESATAYHTMTALKFADIELHHSLFKCHIPMVRLVCDTVADSIFPAGRGVMPHLSIPLSIQELAHDGQLLPHRALQLIAQGTYLPPLPAEPQPQRLPLHCWLIAVAALLLLVVAVVLYRRRRRG